MQGKPVNNGHLLAMQDVFMGEPTTAGLVVGVEAEEECNKSTGSAVEGRNGRAQGSSRKQEGRQG